MNAVSRPTWVVSASGDAGGPSGPFLGCHKALLYLFIYLFISFLFCFLPFDSLYPFFPHPHSPDNPTLTPAPDNH